MAFSIELGLAFSADHYVAISVGPEQGLVLSDPYAHKCCRIAGIKSKAKHYKYKKPGDPTRVFPNLLLSEMQIDGPLQCIVSDMTAFHVKGVYYELTLYMDLWNNEIVSHALSARRGDRMTYISGLEDLLALKKLLPEHQMILHSDQGSVYSSKSFNDLLPMYGIARSMSRAGTPTDNAAMEAINGWIKAELFSDLHVTGDRPVQEEVDEYIVSTNPQFLGPHCRSIVRLLFRSAIQKAYLNCPDTHIAKNALFHITEQQFQLFLKRRSLSITPAFFTSPNRCQFTNIHFVQCICLQEEKLMHWNDITVFICAGRPIIPIESVLL